jgi:hypothetical protein
MTMSLITIEDEDFEYLTLQAGRRITIYGWGTYPDDSVLAGQARKVFLNSVADEAEALVWLQSQGVSTLPDYSSHWTEPQVCLSHLPDDSDY